MPVNSRYAPYVAGVGLLLLCLNVGSVQQAITLAAARGPSAAWPSSISNTERIESLEKVVAGLDLHVKRLLAPVQMTSTTPTAAAQATSLPTPPPIAAAEPTGMSSLERAAAAAAAPTGMSSLERAAAAAASPRAAATPTAAITSPSSADAEPADAAVEPPPSWTMRANATCNAKLHAGYGGGAFTWGMSYHVSSAQECCDACLSHASTCTEEGSVGKVYYHRKWEGNVTAEACVPRLEARTSGFGCYPAALLPALLPRTEQPGDRDSPPQRCPSHMSSNEGGTHKAQPCNIWVFCPTLPSDGGLCWSNDVWNHSCASLGASSPASAAIAVARASSSAHLLPRPPPLQRPPPL